jgi:hypothetical protein
VAAGPDGLPFALSLSRLGGGQSPCRDSDGGWWAGWSSRLMKALAVACGLQERCVRRQVDVRKLTFLPGKPLGCAGTVAGAQINRC